MRNKRPRLYSVLLVTFLALTILVSNKLGVLTSHESIASGPSGCQTLTSFGTDLLFKNPVSGTHNAYIEIQTQDQSNNSLNISPNSKLEFFFKYIPRGSSLTQPMPIFVRTHSDMTSAREQLSLVSYSDKFKLQYLFNADGFNFSILGVDALDSNCWKHVAIVYRSHSIELWRDGRLQGAIDGVSFNSGNLAQNKLIFGRNLATVPSQKNGFNGLIDEIRISNIAEGAEATVPTSPYGADENISLLLHLDCNFQDAVNKNTVSSYGQTAFVNPSTSSISFPNLAQGCGPTATPIPTQISPSPSASPTPTGGATPTPTPSPTLKPFVKTHYCSANPSLTKNNTPCFTLPTFLTNRALAAQIGTYSKTMSSNSYYRELFTGKDDDGDNLSLSFEFSGVSNRLLALPGSQGSNCNAIPTPTPAPQVRGSTTYTVCGFIPRVSSTIPDNERLINVHYLLNDNHGGVLQGDYILRFY